MLLSGALFALFMMGFWLYCLTDAILTPAAQCRGLPKAAWIAIITLTFIGGAVAWLIAREPLRYPSGPPAPRSPGAPAPAVRWDPDDPGDPGDPETGYFRSQRWTSADDAVARHPAGRGRLTGASQGGPQGPDDDPEFLRALARAIRGNPRAGSDLTPAAARSQPATPE